MLLFNFGFLCCCFVFVLDVGDAKIESSEGGTKDSEREELITIIRELEEQNAQMAEQNAQMAERNAQKDERNAQKDERMMQMAKTSAKESEATGYLRATIKALRREKREDLCVKTNEKLERQLEEYKSREATVKRLKDAAFDSKSANGSVHGNSARLAAEVSCVGVVSCPKAVNTNLPILLQFKIKKTWYEARSFCKALGGDLASLPNGKQLVHAAQQSSGSPYFVWVGARCIGTYVECRRVGNTKSWTWLTGEEIPLSSPYWLKDPTNGRYDPVSFTAPGCLYLDNAFKNTKILTAVICSHRGPSFLCQF